jgi:hypothetical protein
MAHYEALQAKLGYNFTDKDILNQVFIAAGAPVFRKDLEGPTERNNLLVLVGDVFLRFCILDEWFPSETSPGTHLTGFVWLLRGRSDRRTACKGGRHQRAPPKDYPKLVIDAILETKPVRTG